MVVSLGLAFLALRTGFSIRRRRQTRTRPLPALRFRHLRLARIAVAMILVGFVGGPISAMMLRDWEPFETLHGWLGAGAACLFVATAVLGRRLQRGERRLVERHALLALLAALAGALTALTGFVLLP
jgi:hypothetical protein